MNWGIKGGGIQWRVTSQGLAHGITCGGEVGEKGRGQRRLDGEKDCINKYEFEKKTQQILDAIVLKKTEQKGGNQ